MADDGAKTLKEWRELKGMSREELADILTEELGESPDWWPVYEKHIARWEEIGWPVREGIEADEFGREVIGPLMRILGSEAGIISEHVPTSPAPGQLVLDPARLEELAPHIAEFLEEHAEEVGLRMAVPNGFDVAPKPYQDLEQADYQAVLDYHVREAQHNAKILRLLSGTSAMMEEHSTDPNAKVGDVLEDKGGKLVPKPHTEDQD